MQEFDNQLFKIDEAGWFNEHLSSWRRGFYKNAVNGTGNILAVVGL